jgi:hypothetical protein
MGKQGQGQRGCVELGEGECMQRRRREVQGQMSPRRLMKQYLIEDPGAAGRMSYPIGPCVRTASRSARCAAALVSWRTIMVKRSGNGT